MRLDFLLGVLEGYRKRFGGEILVEVDIDESGSHEPLICVAVDKSGLRRVLFL